MNMALPTKDIDLKFFVFIERYATSFLKWDLLSYFGTYPNKKQTAYEIAQEIGRGYQATRLELGDLAMLGVLEKSNQQNKLYYQLSDNRDIRAVVAKFA